MENDTVLIDEQLVPLTKDTLITFMFSTIYPCRFDNPLTDLLWLKEIIDEFEEEAISMGYNPHARIYQCNYRDGICFLLEMCEECPLIFRNCEGTVLCDSSKVTEINTCSELNIDFENIELIWEKNATLCNCIMDTLKGEWKLFKSQGGIGGWTAYPTSTIILKILNQNEDGSINYEIFAEGILNQSVAIRDTSDYHFFVLDTLGYYYTFAVDTFFYKGSFQYSYYLQFDQKFFLSDIKILYLCWKLFYWYKPSGIFVGEVLESGVGRRSKGILTIFMPDVVDGYVNYYEKIK